MRKTVYYIILLLFYHSSLTAQSDSIQKGWAATFTAALIPISQPGLGLQPGIEYRFNDRLSLLAEVSIPIYKKVSKDSSEMNKKYLRIKSEMRYSLLSKNKKSHLYTGFQVSRASRTFISLNSFYYDNNNTDSGYYYSKANINSPVTTISLQFGTIISFSDRRLALDLFAGIGGRFINTEITNIIDPVRSAIRRPDSGPSFIASYSYAGNITMLQLNGGVRLMWHFYQLKHSQKK